MEKGKDTKLPPLPLGLPGLPQKVPQTIQEVEQVLQEVPQTTQEVEQVLQEVPQTTQEVEQVLQEVPQTTQEVEQILQEVPQTTQEVEQVPQKVQLCQITDKTLEDLKGKIPDEKLEIIKSKKKRYFLKEELTSRFVKLNFIKEEIDIIFSFTEELDRESFSKRYGMTPEKYREWLESLETYKDNPGENPFYYVHPPLQVLEEEEY